MRTVPDIIVIGSGHAGIEAALASSRMGTSVLMLTLNKDTIGTMSCNPAIGGVGKGQLVKEIDALGGEMARAADACGIQFRILNASKGSAVRSSRAQIDMELYRSYMTERVLTQDGLKVEEAQVKRILVEGGVACGVLTSDGRQIRAKAVLVAPGTFLNGIVHIGLQHHAAGRLNEPSAVDLDNNLKELGFNSLRFKTGTCARLDKNTIDFSRLIVQDGDSPARPFSFSTKILPQRQVPCYITYTNKKTHEIIRRNLNRSPLYSGIIKSTGVRYCPSIEDKVVKFPERERHQVFLEPQGLNVAEIYPNGISTSLPEDVQLEMIRSIEGLEKAEVLRFGYAIEHTVVEPTQLYPTLETKGVRNLYLAGQINGTTGYEEAASQGLVAGINAALLIKGKGPLILDRASSYIGVLIDDLTTKGTSEPYRMFTSRVEYRLILREDNADLRLSKIGHDVGLVSSSDYRKVEKKAESIRQGMEFMRKSRVKPTAQNKLRKACTLEELLRRPQVSAEDLLGLGLAGEDIQENALRQIEIEVKYSGFIQRQLKDVERFKNLEKIRLPQDIQYSVIPSLSREIKEKLSRFRPLNLGQASRISGVTPAAISILMVYLRKFDGQKQKLP